MLEGRTGGGVLAAGSTVTLAGDVVRSVRALGRTVVLRASVGSDAVLAGESVVIEQAARIGRDLVAAGATVRVSGAVSRNAWLAGGRVVIGGPVHGDVEVQANHLVVLSSARIGGRLRYATESPVEIQSGARAAGGIVQIPTVRPRPRPGPSPWRIVEGIWLLVLGLVIVTALPTAGSRVVNEIRTRFGWSLLAGFVLLCVAPVAMAVLLVTVVGVPLSGALFLLVALTLYPAQVFVSAWLGDAVLRVARPRSGQTPSVYWALVVGTAALILLFAIPLIGWVVRLLAVLAGFGALWAVTWRAIASSRTTAQASRA